MSRYPKETTTNPSGAQSSVVGVSISGNARLRVRGSIVTTGTAGSSVVGLSASGGNVTILGDVVTRGGAATTGVTVDGGMSVSGTGTVSVGGRVIRDDRDVSASFNANPSVQIGPRLLQPKKYDVIQVVFNNRVDFMAIHSGIIVGEARDGAPPSVAIRVPENHTSLVLERLRVHPGIISVNGQITSQGVALMQANSDALPAMGNF